MDTRTLRFLSAALLALLPAAAHAHVKWFAPFVVGAPPVPLAEVVANRWIWTALLLVAASIAVATFLERTAAGPLAMRGLDAVTSPLRARLDDFMRAVIAAFFVALFAIGNTYLTPELGTDRVWVSWAQLLIAAGVFSRRTMPLSAAGIIVIWLIALQEYDFFHLLDYLPLGVAVAGYLLLAASSRPEWHARRFEVLRWGVAIALMWSSLEKFFYPSWFQPLVVEKPYLTFGMAPDMFVPMAGVAEFAMGFGLIWTPLVRRLSAVALLVIFSAAVWPFGRIDLVGHALIMGTLLVILADDSRVHRTAPRRLAFPVSGPARLAGFLVVMGLAYPGLINALYGEGRDPAIASAGAPASAAHAPGEPGAPVMQAGQGSVPAVVAASGQGVPNATAQGGHGGHGAHGGGHGSYPGRRNATSTADPAEPAAVQGFREANRRMHADMEIPYTGNADVDFVRGMIAHHQGAVDMAEVVIQHGRDPEVKRFAEQVAKAQREEIAWMRAWLERNGQNTQRR